MNNSKNWVFASGQVCFVHDKQNTNFKDSIKHSIWFKPSTEGQWSKGCGDKTKKIKKKLHSNPKCFNAFFSFWFSFSNRPKQVKVVYSVVSHHV